MLWGVVMSGNLRGALGRKAAGDPLQGVDHRLVAAVAGSRDAREGEALEQREGEARRDLEDRAAVERAREEVGERALDGREEVLREGADARAELRVRTRRDDDLEHAGKAAPPIVSQRRSIAASSRSVPGRERREGPQELRVAALEEVLDGAHHELVLRPEVVELGAAREAGAPGDLDASSCARSRPRRATRSSPRRASRGSWRSAPPGSADLGGAAGRCCGVLPSVGRVGAIKHTVKTACFIIAANAVTWLHGPSADADGEGLFAAPEPREEARQRARAPAPAPEVPGARAQNSRQDGEPLVVAALVGSRSGQRILFAPSGGRRGSAAYQYSGRRRRKSQRPSMRS